VINVYIVLNVIKGELMNTKKKMGRPSVYEFHKLEIGDEWTKPGSDEKIERMRRAVYSYGQNAGRAFRTAKKNGKLYVQRTA
jgi:hypothetical protein